MRTCIRRFGVACALGYAGLVLHPRDHSPAVFCTDMICSLPMAHSTSTSATPSSSRMALASSIRVSGILRSSLELESSSMRDANPSSSMSMHSNDTRFTTGISIVCVEGDMLSYFLSVKMSSAVNTHLAWPCLPVLEVLMSTTLQGKPLINKYPPFLTAPASDGMVREAPASAFSKVSSSSSPMVCFQMRRTAGDGVSLEVVPH